MVDIYLVGVGGQGIITASRILGEAALQAGKNVLLSETHGMAQRGGSVVCTARIGDVNSPLIPDGGADLVLSFELLETLRGLCKATRRTLVVASSERVIPLSVSKQKLTYPSQEYVIAESRKIARDCIVIDSHRIAIEAGAPLSSNVVMLGGLWGTGATDLEEAHFAKAIEAVIPHKVEENKAAFRGGSKAVADALDQVRMF